jgi:peptidoglycan/xylan/chitin deacetylase (PgdA/CDA1 family)
LKQLQKYVRFVNIEEAVRAITDTTIPDYPMVAFTFDDGFEDCYSAIAPILEDFGVSAAFFINPNFAEGDETYIANFTERVVFTPGKRPMRWNEIADLHRRGHIIGAHTMDHYMINNDSYVELEYQIGECKSIIEDKLSVPCDYFAFPYGRLEHANMNSIDIACKYYRYVFSQSDYRHYFSFDGRVINRRHFEPFWPVSHVYYFLSCNKK